MAASDSAIRIRDLEVGFGDRTVLDGLTLEVRRGEILGILGASGGGKSVLLRAIIGLLAKRRGTVDVLGTSSDTEEDRTADLGRRWGVLFQHGALFSSLTVLQNVQFPMREHLRLSERLMKEVAMAKLELVGLSPDDSIKMPSELSGGMTKRVALARALALDPEIVFLDEPTSGLDPIAAGEFDTLIRTLHKTLNLTVFMVTHDLESVATICDRVAVLAQGRIAALGTMADILASPHPAVHAYFGGERARLVRREPALLT